MKKKDYMCKQKRMTTSLSTEAVWKKNDNEKKVQCEKQSNSVIILSFLKTKFFYNSGQYVWDS